jgi:hypothetical protein
VFLNPILTQKPKEEAKQKDTGLARSIRAKSSCIYHKPPAFPAASAVALVCWRLRWYLS